MVELAEAACAAEALLKAVQEVAEVEVARHFGSAGDVAGKLHRPSHHPEREQQGVAGRMALLVKQVFRLLVVGRSDWEEAQTGWAVRIVLDNQISITQL
jgi:hypothetical protein